LKTDSKSKYGLENNLDIGNVLKEQGVRIDDLMALRDSLMKGDTYASYSTTPHHTTHSYNHHM
jgi:hypothetical protein